MEHVPWARVLAGQLLAEALPRRWSHTKGVGRKAESIAHLVALEAELLICAAWLHDIGYAPELATTGFHPLDGARYLRDVRRADERLCRLVAHHSFAAIEAEHRGLSEALTNEFPLLDGLTMDALVYCDMTTSPDGDPVDVDTRLAEILARYGATDVVAESITRASPHIIETVKRIGALLGA